MPKYNRLLFVFRHLFTKYALVAQLVEHRPFKAGVLGSSPSQRTRVAPHGVG